eukprot:6180740-Pleurochrysis_carterae.AAC.1
MASKKPAQTGLHAFPLTSSFRQLWSWKLASVCARPVVIRQPVDPSTKPALQSSPWKAVFNRLLWRTSQTQILDPFRACAATSPSVRCEALMHDPRNSKFNAQSGLRLAHAKSRKRVLMHPNQPHCLHCSTSTAEPPC